jgi:Tn3 transposase DDE domain
MALRDGLRSGDVYVPGSRRYADPASFLLTPQQWEQRRLEFCHLVGKPAPAADALAGDELHAVLADLEAQLARSTGPGEIRLGADGELVIPPLTAEDVPAEAEALRPAAPCPDCLGSGGDRRPHRVHRPGPCGRQGHPASGAEAQPAVRDHRRGRQHGLGAMAESSGVPYDVLAWGAEWYFRAETLAAASAAIVDYHHRLPMTQAFGTGTLSSSDGQRFPVTGNSLTARHLSRYFARGQGISAYTHASDQHSTFDTKVIVATAPESHHVLDGILGNQTDLPAIDTHGATLANFALFDLLGLQLPPASATWARSPWTGRAESRFHVPLPVRRQAAHPTAQRRTDHRHGG